MANPKVYTKCQKVARKVGLRGERADEFAGKLYNNITPEEFAILTHDDIESPKIRTNKVQYRGK